VGIVTHLPDEIQARKKGSLDEFDASFDAFAAADSGLEMGAILPFSSFGKR
jgi:hypothetical protein